jgi:hypothetical protein
MSCYGDIYLRKDLITCDPKYGVSLNALVKEIVDSINSSSSTSAFSCASLASCSINALSDVSLTSVSAKQLLVYESGQFKNKTFGDAYSITDIGNVSLPSDIISSATDQYNTKVLGWSFTNKRFELQDSVSTTYTPSLIVGDSDSASDDIYSTASDAGPTGKLIFKGGGNISVSYSASTNTFTIQDLSSPIFNGFAIVTNASTVSSPTTQPSLFFGANLPTVKFYFASITNDTNIKTDSTFNIKDDATTVLSNQAYGSLRSGPAITSSFTASPAISNTTFASKTYNIEGINKNDQPFAASTNIRWGTNYLYGYTYLETISANDLNNANIDSCSPSGLYKKAKFVTSKATNITLTYPIKKSWTSSTSLAVGDIVTNSSKVYMVTSGSGTTSSGPTHTSNSQLIGSITYLYVSNNVNANPYLFIAAPTTFSSIESSNGFEYLVNSPVTLSSVKQFDASSGATNITYSLYRSTNTFDSNANINLS